MAATPLFRFVQVEVPWRLGPDDGRYVVRGHAGEPEWVLVLRTLEAPARRRRLRRRPADEPPRPDPAPVTLTRATLIAAHAIERPEERVLAGGDLEDEVGRALTALNRVLHVHRLAAADPTVIPVGRDRVTVARVGVGTGELVAEGRWEEAVVVPAPARRRRRGERLGRSERLAAVLGARDVVLACESLVLRGRADADAGRWREAAFQVRVGLEAALAELEPWAGQGDMDARLAELAELRGPVGAAANAALQGGLADEQVAAVRHALERLEAALRARDALPRA